MQHHIILRVWKALLRSVAKPQAKHAKGTPATAAQVRGSKLERLLGPEDSTNYRLTTSRFLTVRAFSKGEPA